MLEYIIRVIHLSFVIWVLITPFTNDKSVLQLYTLFIPFLFLHWTLNDDTCILTVIEKAVSDKKHNSDTFTGRIVGPIYKLDDSAMSQINKIVSFGLWLFTMFRLHGKTYDFFKLKDSMWYVQ